MHPHGFHLVRFLQLPSHTTGQACSRLVYFSAAEARFWLFITSRRLSRCARLLRDSTAT